MNMMPAGKEGFWRLALLPFKAYIVAVPVVGILSFFIAELAGWNDLGTSASAGRSTLAKESCHRYAILEYGYLVCVLGLLVGAFSQRERKARRSALIFSVLGIISMVLLFPATRYAKTKYARGPNKVIGVNAGATRLRALAPAVALLEGLEMVAGPLGGLLTAKPVEGCTPGGRNGVG